MSINIAFSSVTYNPALLFLILLCEGNLYPLFQVYSQKLKFYKKKKKSFKKKCSQCIRNKLRMKYHVQLFHWGNFQYKVHFRIIHIVSKQQFQTSVSAPSPTSFMALSKSLHLSGPRFLHLSRGLQIHGYTFSWDRQNDSLCGAGET